MATLNLQVGVSAGDSRQQSGTSNVGKVFDNAGVCSITETVLSPGSHGLHDEWSCAFRFTSVTIAQGATISAADFVLTPQATWNAGSNVIKYHVSAQAADNAGALTAASGDLRSSTRARTTADTAWTQTSITVNVEQTASITAVIQEIVNRAGWVSGNAIVILMDTHADTTEGEWQDYEAYDGTPAEAAKLNITYTTGGAARVIVPVRTRQAIKRASAY